MLRLSFVFTVVIFVVVAAYATALALFSVVAAYALSTGSIDFGIVDLLIAAAGCSLFTHFGVITYGNVRKAWAAL